MGDTRRFKKIFAKPFKPWDETRIEDEKKLTRTYGLKNKKEIWRAESLLRRFKAQAKKLITKRGEQAAKEKEQMLNRLASLGLATKSADLDTVLGLGIGNILDRRLQTLVYNRKMARTISQARQFIIHEHVLVNGKKIAVPSYLVKKDEEEAISFDQQSSLASELHPERVQKKAGTPTDTEPVATPEKAVAETTEA